MIISNIRVPLTPDYYIVDKNEKEYTLRKHKGETCKISNMPE